MPKILSEAQIGDFRDRLIDIAERRFAQSGPEAVSLRQLASELGVSPMTPYRYFKDKDDILAAVRARGFDRFAEALECAAEGEPHSERRADAIGAAYVRFAFDHPAAYRLMFDLDQPTAGAYPDLVRASARARATLTADVPAPTGGRKTDQPVLIAHACWAGLHGLVMLKLAGKLAPEADFDAVLTTMTTAMRRGFASSPD